MALQGFGQAFYSSRQTRHVAGGLDQAHGALGGCSSLERLDDVRVSELRLVDPSHDFEGGNIIFRNRVSTDWSAIFGKSDHLTHRCLPIPSIARSKGDDA